MVLTHDRSEESGGSEYRLVNWESGEVRFSYPAAGSSYFGCVSRDGSLAAAFEDITKESFTVHKMDLRDGSSEKIVIPAQAEAGQIHAAADGERIVVYTGHSCVVVGSGGEYRMEAAETESMAVGCFSPNGEFLAQTGISPYSDGREAAGQGLTVIRTEKLPVERENVYSAEMYGISRVDINNEGIALAGTIVFFPDTAGFAVLNPRRSGS